MDPTYLESEDESFEELLEEEHSVYTDGGELNEESEDNYFWKSNAAMVADWTAYTGGITGTYLAGQGQNTLGANIVFASAMLKIGTTLHYRKLIEENGV